MYQRRNRGKPQFNRVPRVFVGAARFILAKVPLGASSYTFAEATTGQDLRNWIGSHIRAFEYFNGVVA